ncbi:MAG: hypothetical protein AB8B85_02700 [Paracoccaceae bacterium]
MATSPTPDDDLDMPVGSKAHDRMAAMDRLSAIRGEEVNAELAEAGIQDRVVHEASPTDEDNPTPTVNDNTDLPRGEGGRFVSPKDVANDSPTDTPPVDETPVDDPPADDTPGDDPEPDLMQQTVQLKIDGRVVERTIADLVSESQMDGAAKNRLEAAGRLLAQAQEQAALASQTPANNPANPDPNLPVNSDAEDLEKAQALLEAVYTGDQEAAAKDLLELITKGRSAPPAPAPDEQAIADAVTRRIEHDSVWKAFYSSHPAIAKSSGLQHELGQEIQAVAAVNPDLLLPDALEQAADTVYERIGLQKPGTEPDNPPPPSDRADQIRQRKATAVQQPRSRTVSSAPAANPVMSSEQSRASTIAEMAARRRAPMPDIPD